MDEVEKLIEQLKSEDGDARIRISAAGRLGEIKDERAVPALIGALKGRLEEMRREAAWALGNIGDASAVPVLIEALDEKDSMRCYVAEALGKIGDVSAVPALIGALKDENRDVRFNAVIALEKIVEKPRTIKGLEIAEEGIAKGSVALRKEKDKGVRITTQIKIARLTRKIAEKKDKLAPKRDLLLDDKPKPPKRDKGIYRVLGRIRNG